MAAGSDDCAPPDWMQRLYGRAATRNVKFLLQRFQSTAGPLDPTELLSDARHKKSVTSSPVAEPSISDLLILRPRLRRKRRRTDLEWAREYQQKFDHGVQALERAFTLNQLQHLASKLQLPTEGTQGEHAQFKKRSIATSLVRSESGWNWNDPKVLLDKVNKQQNFPPATLGLFLLLFCPARGPSSY